MKNNTLVGYITDKLDVIVDRFDVDHDCVGYDCKNHAYIIGSVLNVQGQPASKILEAFKAGVKDMANKAYIDKDHTFHISKDDDTLYHFAVVVDLGHGDYRICKFDSTEYDIEYDFCAEYPQYAHKNWTYIQNLKKDTSNSEIMDCYNRGINDFDEWIDYIVDQYKNRD